MEVRRMIRFTDLMYFALLIVNCEAVLDSKRLLINDPDLIMRELGALKEEFAKLNSSTQAEIAYLKAMKAENANLNAMKTEILNLKSTISQLQNGGNGALYTRWGKNSCPGKSTKIYTGFAAGKMYNQTGSGSNFLCLPTDPLWGHYNNGVDVYRARIHGTEYEGLEFITSVHDENAPCSVCRADSASTTLMIPGRNRCYPGWNMEYNGYLVAEYHEHKSSTQYICLDSSPDVLYGGHANEDGALWLSVEGICGSLPCPPYVNGRELTCVVCSK